MVSMTSAAAGDGRAAAAVVLDHANRRYGAPVMGHRYLAGSDTLPETRVSHDRCRRPPVARAALVINTIEASLAYRIARERHTAPRTV
jgi:hypothetical protein